MDELLERANRCAGESQKFYQRHESRKPQWRLLDALPRLELKNAPPREVLDRRGATW